MSDAITIHYLEMLSPGDLRAVACPQDDWSVIEARVPQWQVNRFLYDFVGQQWLWTDKSGWSDDDWRRHVERDDLRTWIAWRFGSPAGYFELERRPDGDIEIAYFGLAPAFIGQGLGGCLLTNAIRQAWEWDARRVWVHTCSLDHPNALANYRARGMTLYREERIGS
jgi:GNAT superfamily N-acetyltransferase